MPEVENNEELEQEPVVETTEPSSDPSPAPAPTNTQPQFNLAELYQDSQRMRIAQEAEIQRLQRELNQRNQPTPREITDDDFHNRPAESVREVIRQEMAAIAGPVNEITTQTRVSRQMNEAEDAVFQSMPQLNGYREALSREVRTALRNAQNVDAPTYAATLQAVVGRYYMNQIFNQQQAPTPAPTPPTPNGAPAPKPNGGRPVQGTPALKPSELERKGMRNIGLDPNKKEDVDKFFAIVNDENGITVQ